MKYLSLFSGIGGFEIGIQNAYRSKVREEQEDSEGNKGQGLQPTQGQDISSEGRQPSERITNKSNQRPLCIGYSEIDKYAIKVYERHFNHENIGDITTVNPTTLADFDLLVGGFPCQAFSVAGKRLGFDDTRGTLFFDIARICAEKRPRHLVLENVKGLLSHDNGKTFETIIGVLTDLGYFVEWQVLNSKDFGVPQNRERVFIVGHLGGEPRRKVFPIRKDDQHNTEQSVIGSTLTSRYPASQREGTYIKKEGSGRPKIRKLTPLECERLMAYPDNWSAGESDTQRYKMCGNGVVSNVVQAVIERLL